MSGDLFRREVLEARRPGWLGGISLAQPPGLWLLTAFAGVAATVVVLFLLVGTYTRRSHVVGQLVPTQGMAMVLAPANAVVTRVDVPEGGRVEAGQTIAVVTMPRATVAAGDTSSALAARLDHRAESLQAARAAQRQLLDTQAAGLGAQLAAARRELSQIQREVATRQEQVRLADDALERLRQLRAQNYVSELQFQQQRAATLEQAGEMQILQRQAITSGRMIAQIEQALAEVPGQRQASDAGYERDLAALEQERVETLARGELAIVAPVGGIVAAQMFKPGQAVQAGQAMLSVLPGDGLLEAELLVPSRAVGFIEPGDKVLLRYQAYPYQKFGHRHGRVSRISRGTLGVAEGGGEPHYRVSVSIDRQTIMAYGHAEPLRPGMLIDADILGERRTLLEWILEPLYSVHGTVFGR